MTDDRQVTAVYRQMLGRVPEADRGPLTRGADAHDVPATLIRDPEWMAEQIELRARIWQIDDIPVLATLWWYSASHFLITPTIASLVVAGRPLSGRLENLALHHRPDSRVTGAASTALVPVGSDPVAAAAEDLRPMLTEVIEVVHRLSRRSRQSLWALATDGLANRALFFGQSSGGVDTATKLAGELAQAIGGPLTSPRFIDVSPPPAGVPERRLVLRQSCCLLYRVPGESLCSSCPRRHPTDRLTLLGTPRPASAIQLGF